MVGLYKKLSLSKKIYVATSCGLILGFFFGQRCNALSSINSAFINIFQITIIPYMVFSIIHSIGSLTKENARLIAKKGGMVLLFLWGVSILYAFCLRLSFPDLERSKFFRPENALLVNGADIIKLFIPTNPFSSLANGYIPAIVIFCLLVGATLVEESKKGKVLEYAGLLASLMKRVNDYIVMLLPLGVLVMSTYTFGTLNFAQFKGLIVYVVASLFYIFFISWVIYPGIIFSVRKLRYKNFFSFIMPPAMVAFSTGSVFLALPVIYTLMYQLDETYHEIFPTLEKNEEGRNLMNIIVPLAWVVPASYKFLVIFYIVFAHWYYNLHFSISQQILYYIGGIPCLFGSNATVVPFLVGITDLPNKAYNIFMIISSFMVYFNNANGAMFIVVCTALSYLAVKGHLKMNWLRFFSFFSVITLIFIALVAGFNKMMTFLLSGDDQVKEELTHMNLTSYDASYYINIKAEYRTIAQYHNIAYENSNETLLNKIDRTGILQVGYNPEAVPFSFFNQNGVLVGYDIDFVYGIAEELNCEKIEFYPINNYSEYKECLEKGIDLDIVGGGFAFRASPNKEITSSAPYMKLTPALVVPDKDKYKYSDFDSVIRAKNITYAFLSGAIAYNNIKRILTNKKIVPIYSFGDFYVKHQADALLTGGEIASAINILYEHYWVYFYTGNDIKLYYAYMMPSGKRYYTFRNFVNIWINVCQNNGLAKKRYEYWVEGKLEHQSVTTWSILDWLLSKIKSFESKHVDTAVSQN